MWKILLISIVLIGCSNNIYVDNSNKSGQLYNEYHNIINAQYHREKQVYIREKRVIYLKSKNRKRTVIHEYGHAIDHILNIIKENNIDSLNYLSSNDNFKKVCDETKIKFDKNVEYSIEIYDIIEALLYDEGFNCRRSVEYWQQDQRVTAEIFANIFTIEIMGTEEEKLWLEKEISDIYNEYLKLIKKRGF